VRRVFRDYAAGRSAKKIARDLNHENIPGPSGGRGASAPSSETRNVAPAC
jgi:hypothetical protein